MCVSKDSIKKIKSQSTEYEKTFSDNMSNKGIVSKINFKTLTIQKDS